MGVAAGDERALRLISAADVLLEKCSSVLVEQTSTPAAFGFELDETTLGRGAELAVLSAWGSLENE